nr:hypothetical protein [Tanacetum cinerariifolium]
MMFISSLKEEHPRFCQSKGLKVKERLVHQMKVARFEVLIESKKMCSLGLMRFHWLIGFSMVHLEELDMSCGRRRCSEVFIIICEINKELFWWYDGEFDFLKAMRGKGLSGIHGKGFEEDKDDKKSGKDGLFN